MSTSRNTASWSEWMRSAQGGDSNAYRKLLEDISPRIFRVIRCYLRDAIMMEDLHQDILLKIHKARHTYDPARPYSPWLGSITRNTIFDYLRRVRADAQVLSPVDLPDPHSPDTSADDTIILCATMARLPETHRSVINLVHLEGLSLAEAAGRLGIGMDAMKARSSRAFKALSAILLAGEES